MKTPADALLALLGAEAETASPRRGAPIRRRLLQDGGVLHFKVAPKGLPRGHAVLALIDGRSLSYRVLDQEEGSALRAQLGQRGADVALLATELDALKAGGVGAAELTVGPMLWIVARHASEKKYQALLKSSLTVEQSARRLGVTSGRVRQLLGARRLYGIKVGHDWRVPAFQFLESKMVPGIDAVVSRLPRDLGLLAVYNWFTTSNPDLCDEEEAPFAPLAWLRLGHPPEDAAALAAAL